MVYATLAFLLFWSSASPAQNCARLLLNAEPFGFGPTAAIAQLAPELRASSTRLGYIGEGHTLDLQRDLPYDDLVAMPSNAADEEVAARLLNLRPNYSHFATATDFRYARLAKITGYQVAVYDPLLWFWRPLPAELKDVDLYLAQNFIGVAARQHIERLPAKTFLIPPLSRALNRSAESPALTLINLGGLQNPYYNRSLLSELAELLIKECRQASGAREIEIATNTFIARSHPFAKTFTPALIAKALEQSNLAYMTSGLGNLIEASSASTPVVWLPPTNDSQGQQIELLAQNGMIDARVDWKDFDDQPPIDYFQAQPLVMREIKNRMQILMTSPLAQQRLRQVLIEQTQKLLRQKRRDLNLRRLVDVYGQGGINVLADYVRAWANTK